MAQYDSVETKLSGLFFPPSLRDRYYPSLVSDRKFLIDLSSRRTPPDIRSPQKNGARARARKE